jgi:hypothetical protein
MELFLLSIYYVFIITIIRELTCLVLTIDYVPQRDERRF